MPKPVVFIEMEKLRDRHSGLGQFCLHLGNELAAGYADQVHFVFGVPKNAVGIFGSAVDYFPLSTHHKVWFNPPRADVWHATHQASPFFRFSSSPRRILTVHDLNILRKYSGLKRSWHLAMVRRNVSQANQLVAISHFTQQEYRQADLDIRGEFPVIYNGNNLEGETLWIEPAVVPHGPFLLTLGIIEAKKRFHLLIPMMKHLPGLQLLIAGRNTTDYAADIRRLAQTEGVADRLLMPGEVSDAEKVWLLEHCTAFLFPSGSEGFGMPVVEAMHFGKPVYLSQHTSLPEIGGDLAFYFQQDDAASMAKDYLDGMEKYQSSPLYAQRLKDRAATFSWRKAAAAYVNLYLST